MSAELLLSTLSSSSDSAAEALEMPLSLSFFHLTPGEKHALTLSTLAGMSTTLGALLAVRKEEEEEVTSFLLLLLLFLIYFFFFSSY